MATTPSSAGGIAMGPLTERPKKHCWACLRRRLVCDSAQPACRRCQKSKIVCPGYDEKQPLRWVQPGKVTSRTRRQPKSIAVDDSRKKNNNNNHNHQKSGVAQTDKDALAVKRQTQEAVGEQRVTHFMDQLLRFQARTDFIDSAECYNTSTPYKMLRPHKNNDLPDMSLFFHLFPKAMQHMYVTLAMTHRIRQLPPDTDRGVIKEAWANVYRLNGFALQSLHELIEAEGAYGSDILIATVIVMLSGDHVRACLHNWRLHFRALVKMVKSRGGFLAIDRQSPHMRGSLAQMLIIESFGNSTSPHNDQLSLITRPGPLSQVSALYNDGLWDFYFGSMCPSALLMDIITVNRMRSQASTRRIVRDVTAYHDPNNVDEEREEEEEDSSPEEDARDLLTNINNFSPGAHADRHGKSDPACWETWALISRVYHSAAAIYCVVSLQGLSVLPRDSADLDATTRSHYDRLLLDLKEALGHRELMVPLMWPLVVAGMRAGRGSPFERAFIVERLDEICRTVGSGVPISAKQVLTAFWDSGKTGWDDCFDRPYLWFT